MRVLATKQPEYVGWWVWCSGCLSVLELNAADELRVHTAGDMKDEGTVAYRCPNCKHQTVTQFSRLKENSPKLKQLYGDRVQPKPIATTDETSMRCSHCGKRCYPVILSYGEQGKETRRLLYCVDCTRALRDALNAVELPQGQTW